MTSRAQLWKAFAEKSIKVLGPFLYTTVTVLIYAALVFYILEVILKFSTNQFEAIHF